MARHNATTTNCRDTALQFPTKLFEKIEARAEQYNSGDITADYVSAVHDQIAEEQRLVDEIRGQITAAVNHNPDNSGIPLAKLDFKDGKEAAEWLAASDARPFLKAVMSKIAPLLRNTQVIVLKLGEALPVGELSLPEIASIMVHINNNAKGINYHQSATGKNFVVLRGDIGADHETLAHELLHSATVEAIYKGSKVFDDMATQVRYALSASPEKGRTLSPDEKNAHEFFADQFRDPKEFVAYAMTSPTFQKIMQRMAADGRWNSDYRSQAGEARITKPTPAKVGVPDAPNYSMWQRFVDAIMSLFNAPPKYKAQYESLLTARNAAIENNQAASKVEFVSLSEELSRVLDEHIARETNRIGAGATAPAAPSAGVYSGGVTPSYSKAAPANMQTQPASQVTSTINKLPPAMRPLAKTISTAVATWGRKALNATVFTEDLLIRAKDLGMTSAKMYKDLANQRAAFTGAHERVVLGVVSGYNDLPDRLKGKGPGTVNQFLYDSTMQRKWGYQPTWITGSVTVDPDTATAYEALGDEGKAFVDKVFELGAKTLAEKKAAVIEGATTEYNILIAAAKKEGNTAEVAELEAEKIKTLKNFGSLMKISGTTPYAPIKRFGNYVVQAMSPQYKAAKESGDREKMRELEKQEQHYYVNFAETEADAERELDKLRATGNYDDPGYRERELAREDLYGGSKTLQAISGMRNRVNAMADSASGPDAAVSKKMVKLLTDLYLMQLGEDSARSSEMNRRNIAGDVDMIRSLETQGMADARLLGAIVYGQPMMESIGDMRKEKTQGPSATHNEKSEVFNELIARHLQSLNYEPTPWVNRMTKATSLWFLATSPSYYIQNATQPWMMSLPMMAAKHGYAASGSALSKAYSDIAAGVKGAKVWGQMEFDALLDPANKDLTAGEKEVIRKLLNSGRIDIGMLSELGDARVDPDGKVSRTWNKVDQGLRGMQLKLEAINRVTTALASYRLAEKEGAQAAYEYADDVLQQTHGDYSAWNAPRAFNNGFGKVALQFRKYQLIQLTLMAKMLRNSFAGESPEVRKVARKAFAYTLGQAFLVGGGKALPVPFVLAWAFSKAFGDGEDEPPEYLIRQWIGNKDIADVLLNGGISALTGTNMSSIGGMGNMLALAPFADFDLTNRGAATEYAFTLMSGPFGGLGLKAADGIGKIANGDYYGGIANLAPKGVGNLMKAGQAYNSGVSQRDGDVTMSPDEVTAWDTAQQAIGFTPQRQVDRMYRQDAEFKISRAITTDSSQIKAEYSKAVHAGDSEARVEAIQKWQDFQAVRERLGFKVAPMSELLKAPQMKGGREKATVGNVQYKKSNERFVKDLAAN